MTHITSIDWNEYRKIALLRESGNPSEALGKFQSIRKTCSNDEDRASILLHESVCYRDLGRFAEAVEAASTAVQLLPPKSASLPYAEYSLACAHQENGDLERAAQELRALLKKYSDVLGTCDYISVRRDAQRLLAAILIILEHAIEPLSLLAGLKNEAANPEEMAELHFLEGQANVLLGRLDRALELYQQVLAGPLTSGRIARAHFAVGEILFNRREFVGALTEFEEAVRLTGEDSPDRKAYVNWLQATRRALHKA
jgi:tetratricopeptide (TPR) repeat protein